MLAPGALRRQNNDEDCSASFQPPFCSRNDKILVSATFYPLFCCRISGASGRDGAEPLWRLLTEGSSWPRKLLPHHLHHVLEHAELGEDFVQLQVGGDGKLDVTDRVSARDPVIRSMSREQADLSPGVADIPMNGVLGGSSFWRQVELLKNHIIHMRILFQPLSGGNFIGVIINMVEHPAARFILIR